MSAADNILIDHIKSPGPWLSWKGCSKAVAIGVFVALTLISLHIYPQYKTKEGEIVYPLWQICYLIILPSFCFILWLFLTQVYLRSGTGYKIGIAYEGIKIKREDWKKTKDILKDLFKDKKIQKKIKLRFVPSVFSNENNKAVKFAKRYKFIILASVEETVQKDPVSHKEIKIRVETKPQYDSFMKTVFPKGIVLSKRYRSNTLLDIIDASAQNLRDILLLFIGTTLFHSEKYEESAIILRYLDKLLEKTLDKIQSPRFQVRYLDMQSRLVRARFPAINIPMYDELNEIKQVAETTICYFDEFPHVSTLVARVRFLTGDITGTVELTEMAIDKIIDLEKNGTEVNSGIRANIYLNAAFLSYIQGYWNSFYDSLKIILNDGTYKTLLWDDLISWLDYVDSLDQFDGIILLKVVYRLLAGQKPEKNIINEAERWVKSDGSREKLQRTLNRCLSLPKNNHKKSFGVIKKIKIKKRKRK